MISWARCVEHMIKMINVHKFHIEKFEGNTLASQERLFCMEMYDDTKTTKEVPRMVWMRLSRPSTYCLLLYSPHAVLLCTNQPKELFCSECYHILFISNIYVKRTGGRRVRESALEGK
jgi:hypothetical protein